MERLRITELLAESAARPGGVLWTKTELGDVVFADDNGRPQARTSSPLSASRKRTLIGEWDQGKSLTAIKPRHVLRLARFFRITRIDELFEE